MDSESNIIFAHKDDIDKMTQTLVDLLKQRDALVEACEWLLDEVDTIYYPTDSPKLIYKAKLRVFIAEVEKGD